MTEVEIGAKEVEDAASADTFDSARSAVLAGERRSTTVEFKGNVFEVRELTMAEVKACRRAAMEPVLGADGKPVKHQGTGQVLMESNDSKFNALIIIASTVHARTGKPLFSKKDLPALLAQPVGKGSIVNLLTQAATDLLTGEATSEAVEAALEEELGNSDATPSSSSS